jgi:hypothetical protein
VEYCGGEQDGDRRVERGDDRDDSQLTDPAGEEEEQVAAGATQTGRHTPGQSAAPPQLRGTACRPTIQRQADRKDNNPGDNLTWQQQPRTSCRAGAVKADEQQSEAAASEQPPADPSPYAVQRRATNEDDGASVWWAGLNEMSPMAGSASRRPAQPITERRSPLPSPTSAGMTAVSTAERGATTFMAP